MMRARKFLSLVLLMVSLRTKIAAQTAFIDLGPGDIPSTTGLQLVVTGEGTDGESDRVTCGPPAALRGARRVRGSADNDLPDRFLYFNINPATHSAVKSSGIVTIRATIEDAPDLAGTKIGLHYSTQRALGPGDLDQAFFQHPFLHELAGSGDWTVHEWKIRDAGFASLQLSAADFRLFALSPLGATAQPCVDRVEVTVGASTTACPSGLAVAVDDETGEVSLSWSNAAVYARLRVLRNGGLAAVLPGTAEAFTESPGPGRFLYEVVALPLGDACTTDRLRGEALVFPPVSACGCPNPDANGDGAIDLEDVALVASNIGLSLPDAGYTLAADVDRNRVVDIKDLELVLEHAGSPPPRAIVERVLNVRETLGGISEPGQILRITSPFARGSGAPQADPASALYYGSLLVVSAESPAGALYQVDPLTGAATEFPARGQLDLNGDPALAQPSGVGFSGPNVWVANRELARPGGAVGAVSILDRRTGSPIAGPTGTGVFAGNEDAVDVPGSSGALAQTAGMAAGGAGPDAPAGGSNEVYFQSNWKSAAGDGSERAASLTGVDLDTGLHQAAVLGADAGVPGPTAFVASTGPVPLAALGTMRFEVEPPTGLLRGTGLRQSEDFERVETLNAEPDARVTLAVAGLPGESVPGTNDLQEYVVRILARLPDGVEHSSVRLEAVETESALERRLRRGDLPGKLGEELRTVALGRLRLRAGAGGNNLILRFPEPGLEVDAIELVGPVGGRLYAATRDPGAIQVHALGLTGPPNTSGTRFRGVLERVTAICPIEAGRGSDLLVDPVALEITGAAGSEVLLVLDAARSTLSRLPLADTGQELELLDCYHVPVAGQVLTGVASGPIGADAIPGYHLASRSHAGAGGGGAALLPSGIQVTLGLHDLYFDRAASDIVRALSILDTRALVVKAAFADGSVRDVSSDAIISSLDPQVAVIQGGLVVKAVASAGVARIRAIYEGKIAETDVCVSPAGGKWRQYVPLPHRARPIPPPEADVRIFPDSTSYAELFGVATSVLRFPLGHVQPFTAILLDDLGRAYGLDTTWSIESTASNTVSGDGIFTGLAIETGEVSFGEELIGLGIKAEVAGRTELEPLAVFDPRRPPAPARALRILQRELRLVPGSRLRFVSLLADANGLLRSFTPEWSSDGLPIDPTSGILEVEYRGETADETFTVVCRDRASGLADATTVTVLYSQVSGLGPIPDAQTTYLAQSFLDGAWKDAMTAAGNQLTGFLKVTKEDKGKASISGFIEKKKAAGETVKNDFNFLLGNFRALFSVEYIMETLLGLEEVKDLRLDVSRQDGVVTLKLRVRELLSAKIDHYRVTVIPELYPLIKNVLKLVGIDFENPRTEPSPPAEEKSVLEESLEELKDSIAELTVRAELASGRFSDLETGTWKTKQNIDVSFYAARRFIEISKVVTGLQSLRGLVHDELSKLLIEPDGGIFRIPIEFICEQFGNFVGAILGPVAGETAKRVCKSMILRLLRRTLKDAVDFLFDELEDALNIEERLHEVIEEQLIQPALAHLVDVLRQQDILKHAREGYEVWSLVDDLGRVAGIRFGGQTPAGASLSLAGSTLPGRLDFVRVGGVSLPTGGPNSVTVPFAEYQHAGLISYTDAAGLTLEGLGNTSAQSGVPFDPTNGLGLGQADLGVSVNAGDVLSSLFRFGGTTAYRQNGAVRGAVSLGSTAAADGTHAVTIRAFAVSAPRFEPTPGAAGASTGLVHVLLLAHVTGDLRFTVVAEMRAPLVFSRAGRTVTMDVAGGAPTLLSPASGEVPFATQIRALLGASIPDLRAFLTVTLGARLPITVEYPDRVAVDGLGYLTTTLVGGDTDAGIIDDFIKATFQADVGAGGEASAFFLRGDCNADGRLGLADAVTVLESLHGGKAVSCTGACDADASGVVDVSDAVFALQWLYHGGKPPPPPFPLCGWDRYVLECKGGDHGCQ